MLRKYQQESSSFSLEKQETTVYNTVKKWLLRDSSERIIEQFRYLFIKGSGYNCSSTRSALEEIVSTNNAQQEFNFIFCRCCQLIINEWIHSPTLRAKIPLLINQIALVKTPSITQSRTTRKLRELVVNFSETEQYEKLCRLSRLINQSNLILPSARTQQSSRTTIGCSIQRYPYLYETCLLGEDSSYEYKRTIDKLSKGVQNRYELDLSRYITYRVRLVEIVRKYKSQKQTKIPKKIINPVENPTFLNDYQLDLGLRNFAGKIDGQTTINILARNFRDQLPFLYSHKELKDSLISYLMVGFDCDYSQEVLKPKLTKYLDSILPDLHANKVDEFTLLRTCSLLLKFLIVDNLHRLNHYFFVDLISQIGATKVVLLLLKIVLICRKAKPYLEHRFAILFTYYESFTQDGVGWLIEVLENLQLGLSIHFGKVDLSLLKII